MVANVFHIIYGIRYLDLISLYRYSELISTITVSTKAIKGLFKLKNKNVYI